MGRRELNTVDIVLNKLSVGYIFQYIGRLSCHNSQRSLGQIKRIRYRKRDRTASEIGVTVSAVVYKINVIWDKNLSLLKRLYLLDISSVIVIDDKLQTSHEVADRSCDLVRVCLVRTVIHYNKRRLGGCLRGRRSRCRCVCGCRDGSNRNYR